MRVETLAQLLVDSSIDTLCLRFQVRHSPFDLHR